MRARNLVIVVMAATAALASAQMGTPVPEECKQLEAFTGKWKGTAKFSFMGETSEGPVAMDNVMILDGRFLQSHHEYEMPGMGKFKGLMLMTYDGAKKAWTSWWYDSSESGNMQMSGAVNDGWYVLEGSTEMEGMGKIEMRSSWKLEEGVCRMKLDMKQGEAWAPMMEAEYKKDSG